MLGVEEVPWQGKQVWCILLDRCVDVEEEIVEYGRCVCILCACMSVVKGYVVFSADEAPVKGKIGSGRSSASFCICYCKEHTILCVDGVDWRSGKCGKSVMLR